MSPTGGWIVAIVAGYLAGSITGARLMGRGVVWRGTDVVVSGTGETATVDGVSPSMLWGHRGSGAGLRAAAIDIAKAFVPVLALRLLIDEQAATVAALAVVVGHVYPLYHRFHGGFGMSPLIGALLVLDPLGLALALVIGIAVGVAVGSAFAMTDVWPVWYVLLALRTDDPVLVVVAALSVALYVGRSTKEMAAAWRALRTDPRPWRVRVADIKDYPQYRPAGEPHA
jgi:acyl phosphate:glycerol-3-phosphate acyltransferase